MRAPDFSVSVRKTPRNHKTLIRLANETVFVIKATIFQVLESGNHDDERKYRKVAI